MNSKIPEKHLEFARVVGRLAREYGLMKVSGQFRPGFQDEWHSDISFHWDAGRHGADAGKISVSSTLDVRQNVDMEILQST